MNCFITAGKGGLARAISNQFVKVHQDLRYLVLKEF